MDRQILFKLADLIKQRRASDKEDSYVKSLLEDGTKGSMKRFLKKL